MMGKFIYTDGKLIALLHKYYNEYGKIPSKTDIKNNPKYPSDNTYFNHFGNIVFNYKDVDDVWNKKKDNAKFVIEARKFLRLKEVNNDR